MICVSAEVILGAFFDVQLSALEYSVAEDGSIKLSEQPFLKVGALKLARSPWSCL